MYVPRTADNAEWLQLCSRVWKTSEQATVFQFAAQKVGEVTDAQTVIDEIEPINNPGNRVLAKRIGRIFRVTQWKLYESNLDGLCSAHQGRTLISETMRHMRCSASGVGIVPKSRHMISSTRKDVALRKTKVSCKRGKHCPPSPQTVGRVQRVEVLSAEVERKEKCWGCQRPVITFTKI